ncbi:transcription initiation factor TFIID subunit 11 [Bufo gargarizans]|uniref:transcription initiation factor TFIID subunit 11 n=1 Tax=Bufo gargarizans TaxID=30331 RepID=UPI001CF314BD|nr:transcription initiation factor TFIID subunit 11 [Bufo gargarizans]
MAENERNMNLAKFKETKLNRKFQDLYPEDPNKLFYRNNNFQHRGLIRPGNIFPVFNSAILTTQESSAVVLTGEASDPLNARKVKLDVKEKREKKQKVDEDEIQKMQILVSSFSEEQLNRYEMYRRSAFPKAAIKRLWMFVRSGVKAHHYSHGT